MSASRSSGPEPGAALSFTYWRHLVRRFFGFLKARPLSPREQSEVAALLAGRQAALFFEQSDPDQRHALAVARRVLARRPGDRVAARAALLHDVGKRGLRLGPWQRSFATVANLLRLPLPGAYRTYIDHGPVGARMLDEMGADDLAVAFAGRHPGPAPPGFDTEQWAALLEADRA